MLFFHVISLISPSLSPLPTPYSPHSTCFLPTPGVRTVPFRFERMAILQLHSSSDRVSSGYSRSGVGGCDPRRMTSVVQRRKQSEHLFGLLLEISRVSSAETRLLLRAGTIPRWVGDLLSALALHALHHEAEQATRTLRQSTTTVRRDLAHAGARHACWNAIAAFLLFLSSGMPCYDAL